jgi:hypothetical protein
MIEEENKQGTDNIEEKKKGLTLCNRRSSRRNSLLHLRNRRRKSLLHKSEQFKWNLARGSFSFELRRLNVFELFAGFQSADWHWQRRMMLKITIGKD